MNKPRESAGAPAGSFSTIEDMVYGVRFCGGCNPRYDRKEALERLKAYFHGRISFENAREDVFYDGLLVLGGCPNCCAAFDQFSVKQPPTFMWDTNQEENIQAMLEKSIK